MNLRRSHSLHDLLSYLRVLCGACCGLMLLCACSSNTGYENAFSQKTALTNNSHTYATTPDQAFKAVKITMVQQGFSIEQADVSVGLLKGLRTYDDPKDPKIAYLITASADITGSPQAAGTIVTVSASQQTVLHRDVHKYFHLLGLVPIPTGKEYQTVVRAEGDITAKAFYQDFFAAVARNLQAGPIAAGVPLPTVVALPGGAAESQGVAGAVNTATTVTSPVPSPAVAAPTAAPTAALAPAPAAAPAPADTTASVKTAEPTATVAAAAAPTAPAALSAPAALNAAPAAPAANP